MPHSTSDDTVTVTIGRLARNDLVLPQRVVSRIHASLEWHDERAFLIDEHSSNGTFVNGARINQPTVLNAGDRLRFSQSGPELVFPDDFPHIARPAQEPQHKETTVYREELRKIINDTILRVKKAAVQSHVKPALKAEAQPPRSTVVLCRHFRELAEKSPRSAVCEAWRILEVGLHHRYNIEFRRRPSSSGLCIYDVINALRDRRFIGGQDVRVLHDLRDMRNKAAHHTTFALAPAQAEAYAAQALNYVKAFEPAALEDIYQSVMKHGRDVV